jgi:murein DD-endopeptidase MepM/ murein hydrolase activator NlpD
LGLFWSIGAFISTFSASSKSISELKAENKALRSKLDELKHLYSTLDKELNELRTENQDLRLAANLPPLSAEEFELGIGGSDFEITYRSNETSLQNINQLMKFVETLEKKLSFEKTEYTKISNQLKQNEVLYSSIPAIKPCTGTIGINGFGMREHPILGINKMHEGIDIITDIGTKVLAAGNGIISYVGLKGGYGLSVEIEHQSGYKTVYAHLSSVLVTEGQKVARGKVVALTGNSGLSTGPHLHYEVHHEGVKLDPWQFFFDDLALFEQKNKK